MAEHEDLHIAKTFVLTGKRICHFTFVFEFRKFELNIDDRIGDVYYNV